MNTNSNLSTPYHYLEVAHNIGKKFAKDAIWSKDGRCNWQGASLEVINGEFEVAQRTFKAGIYHGLSGIAIFLSELYIRTQNPVISQALEGTVNNILHQNKNAPLSSAFSFFSGELGVGYTLWRIGTALNQNHWKEEGLKILLSLQNKELAEDELDVINGAAGAIPVLIGIYQKEEREELLEIAIKCGQFLLDSAVKKESVWYWQSIGSEGGLTGYSHGAAGFGNALLDLHLATKDAKFYEAAIGAFQFEKQHFVPEQKNWPDFRVGELSSNNQAPNCGTAWCHGAPGIVLSRIKAFQQTQNPLFLEEANIALETTYNAVYNAIRNPQHSNFSLCHGIAGNADILLSAGMILSRNELIQMAEQAGNLGINLYDRTGTDWTSGINDPSHKTKGMDYTPGFMMGAAGTGFFYLRLADKNLKGMLIL